MTATRCFRAAAGALTFCLVPVLSEAQQKKAAPPRPADAQAVQRASAAITQADFSNKLQVLSHDSMRGRLTGTPGLESAARYVEAQLRALGLKPAGDAGGFVQRYALNHYRVDVGGTTLSLGDRALAATTEFGLFPSQKQDVRAELVYAGQLGDSAPHLTAQLAGKILAFSLTGKPDRSWDARLQRAVRAVGDAGAAGIVVFLDSAIAATMIAGTRPALEREYGEMAEHPRIALSNATAARAFAAAGLKLDSLQKALTGDVAPLATGITVTLRQPLAVRTDSVPNVVALLPGSDRVLRDEYIVVSAHMDHVGVGRPVNGDSIYNGADDNASGTTALLEIARAFKALPRAAARSVIFLAVSGEEQGLRGSAYWVKHATVPFERVAADVNLDMVTRNAPDTIAVLGQELSSLGPAVREIAAAHPELKLTVLQGSPSPELPLIQMSDQYSFLRAGVPSVFFNSGLHADLHRPTDEIARCDADKGARVARLAFLLAHAAAQAPERPVWTEEGKKTYPQKAAP